MRLPAEMHSLGAFRSFVIERARHLTGEMPELIPMLDLVLEEVLTNIIKYAYPEGPGEIEIACEAEGMDRLHLSVCDRGVAFNPLDRPLPDLSGELTGRTVGGMGIYLVRQLVSKISYSRKDGCNILRICFEKQAG